MVIHIVDNTTVLAQEGGDVPTADSIFVRRILTNRLVVISVEVGDSCDHNLMRELTGIK